MKSPTLKRGDLVRMNYKFKSIMKAKYSIDGSVSSWRHIKEFGRCIGVIQGLVDWGNGKFGPEYDVRWKPSKLRYCYHPDNLDIVKRS